MTAVFRPFIDDPALRLAVVLVFLLGAVVSSAAPHLAVLGVREFGMGDRGYAVLLAVSTIVSVGVSVWAGIRADQTTRRRGLVLGCAVVWTVGQALMTFAPGRLSFVVAMGLLLPVGTSLMGQIFALARLAASTHPAEERDRIMSTLRAMFAAPFVVVLPLWSAAFGAGVPVLAIFPVSLLMTLAFVGLALRHWPRDDQVAWVDARSGLSFRAALSELGSAALALRVTALGAVTLGSTLYMSVIGLLMAETPGRDLGDAALYVGLVAGLEVPFMLILPGLLRGVPRTMQMALGAAVYALHMLALPMLAGTALMWLLILPAAAGGALTLTVPIAYLQDLLAGRPGTAASLLSAQWLAASLMAAVLFALGTTVSGYGLVLLLGALVSTGGATLLHLADRHRGVLSAN
jgi:MFS transporter, SET family, sugar efflux transporter